MVSGWIYFLTFQRFIFLSSNLMPYYTVCYTIVSCYGQTDKQMRGYKNGKNVILKKYVFITSYFCGGDLDFRLFGAIV